MCQATGGLRIVAERRWQVQNRREFVNSILIHRHTASTIRARDADVIGLHKGEVAEWSNALVLKTSKGL